LLKKENHSTFGQTNLLNYAKNDAHLNVAIALIRYKSAPVS